MAKTVDEAVLEALKQLKKPCSVELYSDSAYVVKVIKEYAAFWDC